MCYAVLVSISCIPNVAHAFSLGELKVLSKPDQAFQAVAAIKLGKGEKITLVETGSASDYALLNLPHTSTVDTITDQIKKQAGKPFVWLKGATPIPKGNFYVLLRVSSNHHTYFLFFQVRSPTSVAAQKMPRAKKPSYRAGSTVTVKNARNVLNERSAVQSTQNKKTTSRYKKSPTSRAKPVKTARRMPMLDKKTSGKNHSYGPVQRKETLTQIARKLKKGLSSSIFQILVAVWERNPDHFINNNMNGLKVGVTLVIPTPEEISRIDNREARKIRLEQSLAWKKASKSKWLTQKKPSVTTNSPKTVVSPRTIVSSTTKDEGPHAEDIGIFPTKFPDDSQNRNRAKELAREQQAREQQAREQQAREQQAREQQAREQQAEGPTKEEDGDLKAILVQLQVITHVLENNQGQQERLEQRITLLEQSRKEWDLLKERVNGLEIARDATHYPLPSMPEGSSQNVSTPQKTWFFWGSLGMAGFGLFVGALMLWLGRRWNRTDHWNNLRALLSATAQKDPELLRNALQESEPGFDETFVPTIHNQKLEGASPDMQKRTVVGNSEETANKLKEIMTQKEIPPYM